MSQFNKMFARAAQAPNQKLFMFWNSQTKKADEAGWRPLEEANQNFRGRLGEYSISYYPNRERCYLAVSRETYPGSRFFSQGFITLQWDRSIEGEVPCLEGHLILKDGTKMKVRLTAPQQHQSSREEGKAFEAATLEISGGRLTEELLEAVVQEGIAVRGKASARKEALVARKSGTAGDEESVEVPAEDVPF